MNEYIIAVVEWYPVYCITKKDHSSILRINLTEDEYKNYLKINKEFNEMQELLRSRKFRIERNYAR